ncbi:hypothetical protein QTP70_019846 [Hemibagrus guttatus]|uniref:ribonuclease H n=1 Tax=Hemibagrus guttatus TaxID=175788 RepID=A0AAE0R030_9TELE|nr:hypothetical protein QTP70_019846 [Hemibagrus guttatus]KAK3563266.1 hypothetical protein QTP86_019340 [Hemibagrus guttatus]
MSIPEEKAMEEYIEEALAQCYICPSTYPAASSFFLVAKKDGGLRPCIDYRALNQITVKFRTSYEVLWEFLYRFVLVYIDDILIYSWNLAGHRHHVAEVLKRLREFQLFLKAEKCSFHQPSVQFLGYNINSSGIRMDEGKVAAIRDWPTPTTVKELQRFLGFANFYRRFIRNYSAIDNPLTSLLRNIPKSLPWTLSAEEAFNTLKEAFTTAPLLVHPDPVRPFIVEVDASTTGVGAVLSQQQGNTSHLHPSSPASSIQLRLSKSCRLIPLKGLPTAMETAELMFNHIFCYFGIPEDIISDRGPQFISRVWKAFFSRLGVAVSLSSGYHPQTNGQTERKIQEIGRYLCTLCHSHQDSWSQYLGWAEYAQNSLRQPSTGLTPFQCVLGYQLPLFPWSGEPSNVPAVDYWFRKSERVWDSAHHQLQRALRRRRWTTRLSTWAEGLAVYQGHPSMPTMP